MKNTYTNYSTYTAYLTHLFGREPSPAEIACFEGNQNLILINRRSPKNNAYHINFTNGTAVQLVADGVILGGAIQLHSQEAGHRFYSVMFEEQGTVEEHYLMLDATVESVVVNAVRIMLVQSVRLITIEDLVLQYNPVMYNLT
ncbi:hypothetical protein [Pontibacter anaerobius]|uniref:Uncharacterized protein n=1 Tax=Pontibacter anaerobius TaxID=2993940 RepID=A0ABT3RHN2_9BACT|nr:hypothetical protein [Pontibacter anaerobius]MCX2740872.1 hypothetical protein [Pontibacter anaerobius]